MVFRLKRFTLIVVVVFVLGGQFPCQAYADPGLENCPGDPAQESGPSICCKTTWARYPATTSSVTWLSQVTTIPRRRRPTVVVVVNTHVVTKITGVLTPSGRVEKPGPARRSP
jgi:hypothetical protein